MFVDRDKKRKLQKIGTTQGRTNHLSKLTFPDHAIAFKS